MQHNAGTPFVLLVVQQQVLPASYMRFEATASLAGKSHIAPLVGEMLQRIQAEVARYERVITYWPSFGPSLEAAVCAALRTTTAAVSRQCGLIPMIGVSPLYLPYCSVTCKADPMVHVMLACRAAPAKHKPCMLFSSTAMLHWSRYPGCRVSTLQCTICTLFHVGCCPSHSVHHLLQAS